MRTFVGLHTYRYIFALSEQKKMRCYRERLARYGRVIELFINNAWGFELRLGQAKG